MAGFKRYLVLNGTGNVAASFDGNGDAYDDSGAHDAAMREASMMATVGAVVAAEVPDPYDGESDASGSVSDASTGNAGATADTTGTDQPDV